MTFIENCRHNILQLVKKLHLYMKGLYDRIRRSRSMRNVEKRFATVAVIDSSVQKTVHVTRVEVFIECMLPAVDARVNSNNYSIHSCISGNLNEASRT